MIPVDSPLVEIAAKTRALQRRVKRLETLEDPETGGDFVHLQTTELSAPAATFTFSSISQDFLNLYILIQGATSASPPLVEQCEMIANGVTGVGTYARIRAFQNDTFAFPPTITSVAEENLDVVVGRFAADGNTQHHIAILLPLYSNDDIAKTYQSWSYVFQGGAFEVPGALSSEVYGGRYLIPSTTNVETLRFALRFGSNFVAGTRFSMYGIRGP